LSIEQFVNVLLLFLFLCRRVGNYSGQKTASRFGVVADRRARALEEEVTGQTPDIELYTDRKIKDDNIILYLNIYWQHQ
jgi:hypothetical protein